MTTLHFSTKYNFFVFQIDLRPAIIDFLAAHKIRFINSSLQPLENYDLFMSPARRELVDLAFDLYAFYSHSASGLSISNPTAVHYVLESFVPHLDDKSRLAFSKVNFSDVVSIEMSNLAQAFNLL